MTGFINTIILWSDVLANGFKSVTDGIDCVIETGTQVYSYTVTGGVASVKGKGDLHDARYDAFGRSVLLTDDGLFNEESARFTITFYPTRLFFEGFNTRNPMVSSIGAVCVIIFTSLLFVLYDFLVRQQLNENKTILEAKRKFVRFVSHEVRTPLNSVCMGLKLMEEHIENWFPQSSPPPQEITSFIDLETAGSLAKVEGRHAGSSDASSYDDAPPAPVNFRDDMMALTHELLGCAERAVEVLSE